MLQPCSKLRDAPPLSQAGAWRNSGKMLNLGEGSFLYKAMKESIEKLEKNANLGEGSFLYKPMRESMEKLRKNAKSGRGVFFI